MIVQNARTELIRSTTKHTAPFQSAVGNQILFFVRRFIRNVDWIEDLLSLMEKLLHERTDFTHFEKLIVEDYLQFRFFVLPAGNLTICDRQNHLMTAEDIFLLRTQILDLCHQYAHSLIKTPSLHPLKRKFKQVLAKAAYKTLSKEEVAILREAYLVVENKQLLTVQGSPVEPPAFATRLIWRLTG